ncbi:MAG TPA: TetR/AcrR family transcriptional regulator [Bacteroidota bacterium]
MSPEGSRERILDAAVGKFMSLGFSKVSVDELVDDLGMSKKTFYKHFKTKEDLIGQVIDRLVLKIRSGLARILETEGDFVLKLIMLLEFLGKTLSKLSRPVQEDLRRNYPELWDRIEEMRRDTILVNFSKLFSEGALQGAFREDVNQEILLLTFLSAVQGVVNPIVLSEASFSADQALHSIMNIVYEGVLTDDAREQYRSVRKV